MKTICIVIGGLYGMLSVILGALGSHALKKVLNENQLHSFEIGVRYLMYHALVLLFVGIYFQFLRKAENLMALLFMTGTFIFSFSIFALTTLNIEGVLKKIIGISTPIGGVLMITAWALLIFNAIKARY